MDKINIILIFAVALGLAEAALKVDNESELREAQAAVFNENSRSGWILLNYVGPSTIHFSAGGEGTASEVLPYLDDDQIQYMVIRFEVEETVRDVFIAWIGPGVGIIEKRKKTAFLGDAQNLLQPFNGDVTALNRDNFNDETIIDRSDPLSGSHVIE